MSHDENELTALWRDHRQAQQARRRMRLPKRTDEIVALRNKNFDVRELTPYQFRVDGRLDLYPIHRRYHDTQTGERGNYTSALSIALRRLRGAR